MAKLKHIPISILSIDPEFNTSLKNHLEKSRLSDILRVHTFSNIDNCIDNLNKNGGNDVLIFKYDRDLADHLKRKTNNILQEFTLIHYLEGDPKEFKTHYPISDVSEYTVQGKRPFNKITRLLWSIARKERITSRFVSFNYQIAILAVIFIIIIIIAYMLYQ